MFRRIVVLLLLSMALCSACGAGELTNLKPKMVAVFKNGLGFLVRAGEARLTDGWGLTDFVPQATLGTFWMSTPAPGSYVEEIVALKQEVGKERDARTIEELLKANIGKRVRIQRGELTQVEGDLVSVADGADGLVRVSVVHRALGWPVMTFPKSQISGLEFAEDPETKTTDKTQEKRIKFKLKNARDGAAVTMAYLSKGITWTPGYLIDIADQKQARITFKATLANDVEDLEDVEFFFVVGYPNFAFSDMMSPMALQQSVNDLIRRISSAEEGRREYLTNIGTQSAVYHMRYAGERPDGPSVISDYTTVGTPGQAEADLFLYSKPGATIKNGERAEYVLFTASADYEHIYEWSVDDTSGVDPYGYRRQSDSRDQPKDAVWHSLRLANSTDYPWTTAPAMVISGNKPLSQDELAYVSKGAKGVLKMTIATDISAGKTEEEIERKHDVQISSRTYDEVTVKGELSVTNYKAEPTKLIVKKNHTGEVMTTEPEAKVAKAAEGLAGINPRSVITWEFTLKPAESKKLVYTAKTYVRP